ncbi:MAG: hypothetical protein ACLSF3_19155, partial [Anaerobutyricum hallii]|uniref:hypothetical protein n=1 Tax=Anaerobutyricum hallii TaxID=39488 RepID=UPI0039950152
NKYNRGTHGDSSLMLSTVVLSNENQTCRDWEAPTSTGGGRMSLIIVFLQFSIKFYFSGCLVLIINSKLMIFVGKRREFPILTNCRFRIARKKKKIIHPRCGLGACLRCERAS